MDDFSGLEYDQESVSEEDVVSKTNNLLSQFNLPTQISSVSDVTASLFVVLYESLFSDRLPGIVRQPVSREDEIHNCQMVIDVLSADVIKDNLSHIRGVDIVHGKVQSVNNLIDIFSFLYEYVIKQIESDAPTDTEDDSRSLDRPEIVVGPQSPVESRDLDGGGDYRSLQAQNGAARVGSNGSLKGASRGRKDGALDSTSELISEGERLARLQDKEQPGTAKGREDRPDSPGRFDFIGIRPPPTSIPPTQPSLTTSTSANPARPRDEYLDSAMPVYSSAAMRGQSANLSATDPTPFRTHAPTTPERLRSTVGALPYHAHHAPEKPYTHRDIGVKGLSSSYQDLHSMVQNTAALTRAAIDTSPLHRHRDRTSLLDITDLSRDRRQVAQSEAYDLARDLNLNSSPPLFQGGDSSEIPLGGRDSRQGAFTKTHPGRENVPPGSYSIPPNTDYARPSSSHSLRATNRARPGKQSPTRSRTDSPPRTQHSSSALDRLKDRFMNALGSGGGGGEDEREAVRKQRAGGSGTDLRPRMSTRLDEMGKPSLASAQRHLETEDSLYNRKHDYLKKLYEEEFEDVVEEVKQLVQKDNKLMKDMEEEYKKLMMVADKAPKKAKPSAKTKGYLLPTTKKSKAPKASGSVTKKSSSTDQVKVRDRPLEVGQEEELMPLLLEEFPHLYLSGTTWHELWRKGLNQIENLTRAYEENKRRKSKAQAQLEEAARKHEILAAIVKKQLDSNHRMRDIKEQKRQQLSLKNKLQEKRSQSARARRYYNEYQVRARSKMLKRRTREELIFKNLFKDGLQIQKERIRDVQRYAKEQREKQAQKRQDEIDSLENYYRDQFEMLVGKLVQDREDMSAREKAHQKLLEQMKRDLRKKMEKEIKDIQSEMFRDDDDAYLRQLEADRLRQELHMAKYQVQV